MPSKNLRILYVEDNPDDCDLLRAYLSETPNHCLEIIECHSLSSALAHCETASPDAILLDLNLPDSTGLSTFTMLSEQHPNLPIIVFTVLDLEGLAIETVRAGAQDYLVKGELSGALIVRAVRYAIERKEVQLELSRHKNRLESLVQERTAELLRANQNLKTQNEKLQQVQNDLTQSRHILRMVADHTPAFLAFVDKDLRYKFVNKQYELAFDLPVNEIVGMSLIELHGQESFDTTMKPHVDAVRNGSSVQFEVSTVAPNTQNELWTQINYEPFHDDDGRINGFFILGRDITENKCHEQRLREQGELLQNILDGMQAAVFFVDVESYTIVRVNQIAEELIGVTKDDLINTKCYKHICLYGKERPLHGCPALNLKTLHAEFLLERPDGKTIPVQKTVLPVIIDDKLQHVAILFDVSERKKMERQLAYAQKLESIGQLAAGIAHEINTPIQYVGSNLHFLRSAHNSIMSLLQTYENLIVCLKSGKDTHVCQLDAQEKSKDLDLQTLTEEIPKAVTDSLEGVDRVATIVQAMKKFSHPDLEERKLVNINEAIENTVVVARNEWKYVAKMELHLAEMLPPVYAIPGDVNQALLNIIVNAAHAISEKIGNKEELGTITITSKLTRNMVCVSIADTGCGIPDAISSRVFDPFFTTKEVGKGTGQGLALTLSMLNKHGGSIDFVSEIGKGTTFYMMLPVQAN